MIYEKDHIFFPDLCPIYFGEPNDIDFYPYQEEYLPKLVSDTKLIAFFSGDVYTAADLKLKIYSIDDVELHSEGVTIVNVSDTYYYAIISLAPQTLIDSEDVVAYFTFESVSMDMVFARSTYYMFNPSYTGDIKKISFTNDDNDYNMIFVEGETTHEYVIDVECGFIPKDVRNEQVVEEFVSQDLINNVIYGDEYTVYPLTIGDSLGVPSWLAIMISKATLCETFKVNDKEYERVEGAKLEKVEDIYEGLAVYKIDLQSIIRHMQEFNDFYGIFDTSFNETFN